MPDIEDLTAIAGSAVADGDLLHLIDITAADVDPKDKQLTAAGLRDAYLKTGLRNVAATTAPGVSNDDTEGYQVGSFWFDVTGDLAYVCLDATTGAAVWQGIGAGAAPSALQLSDLTDVNTSTPTNKFVLVADGVDWESRVLQLTDLTDVNTATVTNKFVLVADGVDFESRALVTADISDYAETVVLSYAIGDETTALTTGTANVRRIPGLTHFTS